MKSKIKKVTKTIIRVMRKLKKCTNGRRLAAGVRALKRAQVSEETILKITYWACDDLRYYLFCQLEEDAEIQEKCHPQDPVPDPIKAAEKWVFAHESYRLH